MKISVVTVCLNSERTIANTIESFLNQTYPNKEMVIVDGQSRDRTAEIANSFGSDAIHVFCEPDAGIYDAMNRGLRLHDGDAVGFLNSDDTFHSNESLELISQGLKDAEIVFGDLFMVADHQTKRIIRTWKTGAFSRSAFRLGWTPPHATFYVRRSVAQTVGPFDLRYRIASDYDYMLRAMTAYDFSIKYVPHVLVDYRWGGTSSGFRNMVRGNLECQDSRRRHLKSAPIDLALFLRPMRRLLQLQVFRSGRDRR